MEVTLPKLGESILTAKVVQWFKKEGDFVDLDEPLLEVSTDKVNSEIPSPFKGVVEKILVAPEEECAVGTPLCLIASESSQKMAAQPLPTPPAATGHESAEGMISPAVLRLASEAHIDLNELKKIPGTGDGGRVTKKDLESYLAKRSKPCPYAPPAPTSHEERIKMTGMRKAIAESMVRSFYQAPHASLIADIDVTLVKKWIDAHKESFHKQHGFKVTITSFIAHALARTLQEFPYLNASIDQDTIVLKKSVNIGIAVSVEKGILVPVIHHAHQKTLTEIARDLSQLSEKARSETLKPADVQGGTITMTNFGMSGVKIGIPIIHYPEVAILGIGAIQRQVVALDDDTFGIRSILSVSLTFDHRIIDGMYGCSFLASLKHHLEKDVKID